MTTAPSTLRTYKGSCHCGAVRFEADLDLSKGTGRCTCTYCTKTMLWGTSVKPEALRVTAGQEHVGDYSRSEFVHHHFCKVCGVRVFARGNIPEMGGAFASVSVNTLDDVDLDGVKVRWVNGRDNTWAPLFEETFVSPLKRAKAGK